MEHNKNAAMVLPSKCTCGNDYAEILNVHGQQLQVDGNTITSDKNSKTSSAGPLQSSVPSLDASFVQIPLYQRSPSQYNNNRQSSGSNHTNAASTCNGSKTMERNTGTRVASSSQTTTQRKSCLGHFCCNNNFEYIQGINALYNIATTPSSTTSPVSLCSNCVQRLEQTIADDTERLLAESVLYEQAIRDDETSQNGYNKQIKSYRNNMMNIDENDGIVETSTTNDHDDSEQFIEDQYMREIQLLETACQEYQEELFRLRSILKEQAQLYDDLEIYSESMASIQNALELEARAFDYDQEQLTRMLVDVQDEIERLMSSEILLPSLLVQLHVDVERGLRYPLINELRLAYRPKGDVQWDEIQTAWALAAYLLLVVATVYGFQSQNWKIVPLSHCAKLIYCPHRPAATAGTSTTTKEEKNRLIVFNLGHPKTNGSKALLMWNALLCEVIQHVTIRNTIATQNDIIDASAIPKLPFDISPTSIGGVQLTKLSVNDDSGWSKVIHYMVSDLQWLSKCASIYILQQVVLLAPFTAASGTESL